VSEEESRHAEGQARAQEIEADVAEADARHVEEERAEAEEAATEAQDKVEKLSRKERKAREKAEQEAREADEARQRAEEQQAEANRVEGSGSVDPDREPEPVGVSGDTLMSPGVGDRPDEWAAAAGTTDGPEQGSPGGTWGSSAPAAAGAASMIEDQRPEVLLGAAFAGAFLFAKLLKRIGH
jgi:hypothetical protein